LEGKLEAFKMKVSLEKLQQQDGDQGGVGDVGGGVLQILVLGRRVSN
jgi:hypothetical protein